MEKKLLNKKPALFDGCAAFICAFLFMYLGQTLLSLLLEATLTSAGAFMQTMACQYIFMALNQICIVGAVFLYGKISGIRPMRAAGTKKGLNASQVGLLVPIALLCVLAFMPLAQLFMTALTAMGFKPSSSIPSAQTVGGLFLSLLIIAVLPAIGEEFVFRGNIAKGLKAKGYGFAIVISAVFFGLFHGNALQLVHQALLGAVLGYVFFATGSFWACAVMHFTNNAVALCLDFALLKTTGSSAINVSLNPWLLAFIFIAAAAVFSYFLLVALCAYTDVCRKKKGVAASGINPFVSAFKIYVGAFTIKGFKSNRAELKSTLDELSFDDELYPEATETSEEKESEPASSEQNAAVALADTEVKKSKKQIADELREEEERKLRIQLAAEKKRKDKRADIMSMIVAFAIVGAVWIFQFVQGFLPEKKTAEPAISDTAEIVREYEF